MRDPDLTALKRTPLYCAWWAPRIGIHHILHSRDSSHDRWIVSSPSYDVTKMFRVPFARAADALGYATHLASPPPPRRDDDPIRC